MCIEIVRAGWGGIISVIRPYIKSQILVPLSDEKCDCMGLSLIVKIHTLWSMTLRKISKFGAARCHSLRRKCIKFDFLSGAPSPTPRFRDTAIWNSAKWVKVSGWSSVVNIHTSYTAVMVLLFRYVRNVANEE